MAEVAQEDLWLLVRVAVAAVLSALVGWERERVDRPAGLRTHMLVGVAAAVAVAASEAFAGGARAVAAAGSVLDLDPLRAVQAVLTGIGFLGAGTIVVRRDGHDVRGLTTGASVFATAAIGLAAGLERYVLATGATALLVFALWPLRHLERHIGARRAREEEAPR